MTDTTSENVPTQGFVLGTALYNQLKFIALVLLPAISTLYFSLGGIWNLPNVTQVIGSITAVDTFLGVLLGLSTRAYNKSPLRFNGNIVISQNEDGKKLYSLELNDDVENIDNMQQVVFKVNR